MADFLSADQIDFLADVASDLEEAMREAEQIEFIGVEDTPVEPACENLEGS